MAAIDGVMGGAHQGGRASLIFLSYAEEDSEAAARVIAVLRQHELPVYDWRANRGVSLTSQMEEQLQQASAYLALMSPHFMASPWCRRERGLALSRDNELSGRGPKWPFIYVLEVAEVPFRDSGFLRDYDWFKPDDAEVLARKLAQFLDQFASPPPPATGNDTAAPRATPSIARFQNRIDELERVVHGLDNLGGEHFWLVVAPPQLGKSWFLDEIGKRATRAPRHWATRLVDLREFHSSRRADVGLILGKLFGHSMPVPTDADGLARIAGEVIGDHRQHLCLLDSAELLDRATAKTLRHCLSRIYQDVRSCGDVRVKLAVIIASRRDDEWSGVTPAPRLESLPLTQFTEIVVGEALRGFAIEMGHPNFSEDQHALHAALVHGLSEGLPALVVRCMEWIREENWVQPGRLGEQTMFARLAHPYVEKSLLCQDGLMPGVPDGRQDQMQALERAFRVLAAYRKFTQSHLRHHLSTEDDTRIAIERAEWAMEDLWQAISATALLKRPLNEAWQELDKTVRRLLFRYFYPADLARITAHQRAREYVDEWSGGQTGPGQVIGLVESLWHQAEVLRLAGDPDMDPLLCQSAEEMFRCLRPLPFAEQEMRDYAARRLRDDIELAATLSGHDTLLDRLIEIVEAQPES
jgi:hypothetical protein